MRGGRRSGQATGRGEDLEHLEREHPAFALDGPVDRLDPRRGLGARRLPEALVRVPRRRAPRRRGGRRRRRRRGDRRRAPRRAASAARRAGRSASTAASACRRGSGGRAARSCGSRRRGARGRTRRPVRGRPRIAAERGRGMEIRVDRERPHRPPRLVERRVAGLRALVAVPAAVGPLPAEQPLDAGPNLRVVREPEPRRGPHREPLLRPADARPATQRLRAREPAGRLEPAGDLVEERSAAAATAGEDGSASSSASDPSRQCGPAHFAYGWSGGRGGVISARIHGSSSMAGASGPESARPSRDRASRRTVG